MNKYHFIVPILILNIAFSCTSNSYKDAKSFSYIDLGEPIALQGTIIEFDDLLMRPVEIKVLDSLLIMKNLGTEYHFHVFNIYDNRKKGELVLFGSGPEDMISPAIISSDDSYIWILDNQVRSVAKCSLTITNDKYYMKILKKIGISEYADNAAMLSDESIISVVLNPQMKRFCLFDNTGQFVNDFGEYPESNLDFRELEIMEAFLCDFVINYKEQKLFMTHKQTDLIDVYSLDGKLINRMHGPDAFFPVVKQVQNGNYISVRSQAGRSRDAYFRPKNAGDEVFVRYSGRVFEPDTHDYLNNTIFVFNWDGEPLRVYKLDKPIFSFDVDYKNRVIYALSDRPDFNVIKYSY